MNKKTYIQPQMEAFNIECINMFAASPDDPGFGGPGSGVADAPFRQEFEEEITSNVNLW